MSGKQQVKFSATVGTQTHTITTVPLDPAKARAIAAEAKSVGATDITVTDAKPV